MSVRGRTIALGGRRIYTNSVAARWCRQDNIRRRSWSHRQGPHCLLRCNLTLRQRREYRTHHGTEYLEARVMLWYVNPHKFPQAL